MSLADSPHPLLSIFWTMFEPVLWLVWILTLGFVDISPSHERSGSARAMWFVFVLFIPLIGVLACLIAHSGSMRERAARQAQRHDPEARAFIQQAAAGLGSHGAGAMSLPTIAEDVQDRCRPGRFTYLAIRRTSYSYRGGT
jgi:hypothetical protein